MTDDGLNTHRPARGNEITKMSTHHIDPQSPILSHAAPLGGGQVNTEPRAQPVQNSSGPRAISTIKQCPDVRRSDFPSGPEFLVKTVALALLIWGFFALCGWIAHVLSA